MGNRAVAGLVRQRAPSRARSPLGPKPTIQRDGPSPEVDPKIEKDQRAIEALNAGLPSGKVWFVDPAAVKVGLKQEESMAVQCGQIVPRSQANDQRKGFDSEAAATAHAVATVGSAAVLQHDGVFLVAPCTGNEPFNRDRVRQIDLAAGEDHRQ